MLRHLALLTAAVAAIGATMADAREPVEELQAAGPSVTLECGGYDESGNVVNREAVDIGTFELPADEPVEVPEVCGGYTADGTFIGDD